MPPERGPREEGRKKEEEDDDDDEQEAAACVPVGTKRLLPVATDHPLKSTPSTPQMLKIGAQNERVVCKEAILMEKLAAFFPKWLCWHENQADDTHFSCVVPVFLTHRLPSF